MCLTELITDLLRFPQLLLGLVLAAGGVALPQRLHCQGVAQDDQQSSTCLLQVRTLEIVSLGAIQKISDTFLALF